MKVFALLPPVSLSDLDHMRLLHGLSVNSTFNEPSVTSAVGRLIHCCAKRTKHFAIFALQAHCALQRRPKSQQSNSGQTINSSIEMTSTKSICFYLVDVHHIPSLTYSYIQKSLVKSLVLCPYFSANEGPFWHKALQHWSPSTKPFSLD